MQNGVLSKLGVRWPGPEQLPKSDFKSSLADSW
jgi:hypothetical protein